MGPCQKRKSPNATTNLAPVTNSVVWTLVSTSSPYTVTNFGGTNGVITGTGKNATTNNVYIPVKFYQTQW